MRRNYRLEALQIIIAIAVIVCTIILFFKSDELSILFPVVFGLACILALIYAFEGVLFNKTRVMRRSRMVVFILLAILLGALTFFSLRTVLP